MKGKKAYTLMLAALLVLSIPVVFSTNDSFSVDYQFSAHLQGTQWVIEDTIVQEISGEPLLPYYPAQILLPQDAVLKDVSVKTGPPVIQEGVDIPWGQPPVTFSNTNPVHQVGKNEQIYNSNTWYPDTLYTVISTESFRGFTMLNLLLYPLQYKPKTGTVKFYETLTVTVHIGKGEKNKLYRGLASDKDAVAQMVDNPDMTAMYQEPAQAQPFLQGGPYPYVIITNSTMAPVFQELLEHKIDYIRTKLVDVSWIYSNYTGYDNPEKIRNFIIDAYNDWDTTYCLLGGDVSAVPYRGFYVSTGGYTDPDMAADMYFGCLDGNFDADGDHIYGEPNDGVDWLEEVFIGRAPVETVAEAEVFVDKVIAYELADKPKVCQFHAAIIAAGNNPDSRQIPWDCEQWVPDDYTIKELFQQEDPITKDIWRDAWDGSYDGEPHTPPLTLQHAGHGNATCYGISSSLNWCNGDVSTLTNTFWPIHMSVACISGQFEVNDCLAETYVKDDCGAIACMLNDNYGWYSTMDASKYSGEFLETMFRGLFSDHRQHLGELLNQAKSYWVSAAQSNSTYRWCYYEINLLGDPETPCLTKRRLLPSPTITITNPPDGSIVSRTVKVTAVLGNGTSEVCPRIDTVEFYIDNALVYTDEELPFVYEWDTTQYADGEHVITVRGYYCGVFRDDDSVTVKVDNSTRPYVEITNPEDGSTVSGVVLVTTRTAAVDTVKFYINGVLVWVSQSEPFEFKWDTTVYPDGLYEIRAEGYQGNLLVAKDTITVSVRN